MTTTAIIPVKRFENSKQRLASRLGPAQRAALAEAMFLDVTGAARRCRNIDQVVVVTADPAVSRVTRWMGVEVLEQDDDEGHSAAASAGVRFALSRGADRVAMLAADTPMLDPAELDRNLGTIPRAALIVPDRHETGTNALVLSPPDAFEPAFGPDSCARHVSRARAAGLSFGMLQIESLAIDLDTPADLAQMRDALVLDPERAPRTAEVIWEINPTNEPSTEEVAA